MTDDRASRQDGVLTRRQAVERFGEAAVRRHLGAGRWQAHGRVVVLHNGPLSARQRLWVALLAAPAGSVLGSWSALAFDGLPTPEALPPFVVIPGGARRPPLTGVCLVRSRRLADADVHPDRLPRRTRPGRSLVDAAIVAGSDDQARLALIRGVQAGATTPGALRDALSRRGRCRRLGLLLETVADLEGGSRSLPEREFALLVQRARLPAPARQAVVQTRDGRTYLDADWPAYGVGAEIHGVHHARAGQLESDWQRHNRVVVDGRRVLLHFTSHQVRRRPEEVVAMLARALR